MNPNLQNLLHAVFSVSHTTEDVPFTVTFIDESSGSPTEWKWDFGDGDTSTVKNPSHKYSEVGIYKIKLTVRNGVASDSLVAQITVD